MILLRLTALLLFIAPGISLIAPGISAAQSPEAAARPSEPLGASELRAAEPLRAGERQASEPLRAGERRTFRPLRAGELRAFALYGPREFSTFSPVHAGGRAAGETASRSGPLDPQPEDPWLGIDKAKHLAFSFLWTLGTQYVAVNKGHLSEAQALPISIGSSAAAGVSKEVYDLRSGPPHVFSYRDLVADAVGILLATGLILL